MFINAPTISLACFVLKARSIYTVPCSVQTASPPGSNWLLLPCFSAPPWYFTHWCSAAHFALLFALSSYNLVLQRICRLLCHELTLQFLGCLCAEGAGRFLSLRHVSFSCCGSAEILLLSAWLACRELGTLGPSVCPTALSVSSGYPACLCLA